MRIWECRRRPACHIASVAPTPRRASQDQPQGGPHKRAVANGNGNASLAKEIKAQEGTKKETTTERKKASEKLIFLEFTVLLFLSGGR